MYTVHYEVTRSPYRVLALWGVIRSQSTFVADLAKIIADNKPNLLSDFSHDYIVITEIHHYGTF